MTDQPNVPVHYSPAVRPDPDPTDATTRQLLREMEHAQEMIAVRLEAVHTRFTAMDKAVELFAANLNRVPTDVDKQVGHLESLHGERFKSVAQQFVERDPRTEQTSRDSKVAVDAALQAAKEAVGEQNKSSALAIAKSEAATTKQIDQLSTTFTNGLDSLKGNLDDVKERLTIIEGRTIGINTTNATHQTSSSYNLAVLMAVVVIANVIIGIAIHFIP